MKKVTMIGLVAVALAAACGGSSEADPGSVSDAKTTVPPAAESDVPQEPGFGGETDRQPVTDESPSPIAPDVASESAVLAVSDLAGLLGIDVATVTVASVSQVTWRDGSLGCPQPGMSYTQALVRGSLIILEIDGAQYRYHSSPSRDPFLCLNPAEPYNSESAPVAPDL